VLRYVLCYCHVVLLTILYVYVDVSFVMFLQLLPEKNDGSKMVSTGIIFLLFLLCRVVIVLLSCTSYRVTYKCFAVFFLMLLHVFVTE
jgi:hypothetical protein